MKDAMIAEDHRPSVPPFPYEWPQAASVRKPEMNHPTLRKMIFDLHGGIDFWRSVSMTPQEMVLDHVWPEQLGGPDNLYNLVPTSCRMNSLKGQLLDLEVITPVLAIIRMKYGPGLISLLHKFRLDEDIRKGSDGVNPWWWKTSEQLIGERLHKKEWYLASPLAEKLEARRISFARHLRREGPCWDDLVKHFRSRDLGHWAAASSAVIVPAKRSTLIMLWRAVCTARRVANNG